MPGSTVKQCELETGGDDCWYTWLVSDANLSHRQTECEYDPGTVLLDTAQARGACHSLCRTSPGACWLVRMTHQSPTTYFIALSVSAAKRKQQRIAWSMDSYTSAYCKMLHLGVILRAEPGRPYEQTAYMPSFPLPGSPILAVSFQSSRWRHQAHLVFVYRHAPQC